MTPALPTNGFRLVDREELLDGPAVARVLRRLAFEIVERGGPAPYLVGIRTGGAHLAARMNQIIVKSAAPEDEPPVVGAIDITLYRDDVFLSLPSPEVGPTELPASIDGRPIILVDDVLFTGRTVRAAMDVLLDWGRPRSISLAVLVDRGCRELPIHADFVGIKVTTTRDQSVAVNLLESGSSSDGVLLRDKVATSVGDNGGGTGQ